MLIASLNKLSDFAHGVDALIGVDLLQLNNLTFDYDTRRVLFSPIDHNIQGTQMRPKPTGFTVRVQVQGHPINLLLDTGFEGVLLYEDRIRAHIPGLRMEPGAKKVSTSADRPAAPDTAPFPVLHGLLESAKGIAVCCLCLGDFFPHDSGLRSYAARAAMNLHPTRSAFPGIPP